MKTVVQTITVLVVVNLLINGFGLAEKASESTAVLDVELIAESEPAPVSLETKLFAEPFAKVVAEPAASWRVSDMSHFAMTPQYGGSETVLVIPTDQMKAEELPTIIEDLNIMSRIFDKKLKYRRNRTLSVHKFPSYKPFISGVDGGTKAIYVQDFAALFLMKVDFPLLPAPEVKEKEVEEPADPVWDQTKREIYSQQEYEYKKSLQSFSIKSMSEPTQYDAEKVEELKQTLTKSLKHATNIRNLKPEEWVILTVRGPGSAVRIGEIRQKQIDDKGWEVNIADGKSFYVSTSTAGKAGSSASTVLTICVKKSDIDAFAKSELDYDQFRQKTQIVVY